MMETAPLGPMTPEEHPAARPAAWWWGGVCALTIALCWAQYYPLLGTWFHHDDFNWLRVAQHWQEAPATIVRGDTGVTVVWNALFYLAYQIGDWRDSTPYYVGLIMLHALCSVLVIWLVYQLTSERAAALFAGIVFATAFVHHEAVGWIAAGLHVLMTALLLLTLCLWLARRRGQRWIEYAGPVTGVLTVLSKDSGVILGPLALLVQHYTGARPVRQVWKRMALWFGTPYVALMLWRVLLPPAREAIPIGGADYSFGLHLLTNAVLCVPQMIVPDLAFPNYHALLAAHLSPGLTAVAVTGSRVALVLISVAAVIGFWRGGKLVRLGIAWCYVAFLPFVAFSYDYARAPRYLYPASVGPALLAGLALAWLWRRARRPMARMAVIGVLAVVVVVNALPVRIMARNRMRDSALRVAILEEVRERVPAPRPGERICLLGLPEHLRDIAWALPVMYEMPIIGVTEVEAAIGPCDHVIDLRDRPAVRGP